MTRAECDAMFDRIQKHFAENSFGLWAVEIPGAADFAGFIGLTTPRFEASFTPCIEIGWRLAADHWGRGYATEGARAALDFAWRTLKLPEVVSMTVPANLRSRRVMEKIGMSYSPQEDFLHPMLAADHPLAMHVLYRIQHPVRC
jgi:RimJ/RimL family protein N-acetyltransferase